MSTAKNVALLLMIVTAGALGAGCTNTVRARPVGTTDGHPVYSVVCRDKYDLCTAAENKACPQGYSDLSYSDQIPVVNGHRTWDFEFMCKSPQQ